MIKGITFILTALDENNEKQAESQVSDQKKLHFDHNWIHFQAR